MSVRTLTCPQCRQRVNVPATLVNARCSSCGTVWNTQQRDGGATAGAGAESRTGSAGDSRGRGIWIGVAVALVVLITIGVVSAFVVWPDSDTALTSAPQASGENASATISSSAPGSDSVSVGQVGSGAEGAGTQPVSGMDAGSRPATSGADYRVVDLPEPTRRAIYDDYREAARTTREKPLPLFQDSAPRSAMERMLQETLDREIRRLAALHDISVDDIKQIIAEGDAEGWDPTPRSNARRDGQPVNPANP